MSTPPLRTARAGRDLRLLRAAVFAAVCVVLAAAGHAVGSCATVPLWTLGVGFAGALAVAVPLAGRARSLPVIVALLTAGQTLLHMLFALGQHCSPGVTSGATRMSAPGSMTFMEHADSMGSMGSMGSSVGQAGSMGHAMSDAALVQQAAHYVCGTAAAALTPARAYRILADAHVYAGPAPDASAPHKTAHALPGTAAAASSLPSLPMLLAHILAALATGWLLRRGDLALLRLIELSAHDVAEGALVRSLRGALALACALCAGLPSAPGKGPCFRRALDSVPRTPATTALQHTVIRRGPPAASVTLAA